MRHAEGLSGLVGIAAFAVVCALVLLGPAVLRWMEGVL